MTAGLHIGDVDLFCCEVCHNYRRLFEWRIFRCQLQSECTMPVYWDWVCVVHGWILSKYIHTVLIIQCRYSFSSCLLFSSELSTSNSFLDVAFLSCGYGLGFNHFIVDKMIPIFITEYPSWRFLCRSVWYSTWINRGLLLDIHALLASGIDQVICFMLVCHELFCSISSHVTSTSIFLPIHCSIISAMVNECWSGFRREIPELYDVQVCILCEVMGWFNLTCDELYNYILLALDRPYWACQWGFDLWHDQTNRGIRISLWI